jgi:hypothetical protein
MCEEFDSVDERKQNRNIVKPVWWKSSLAKQGG